MRKIIMFSVAIIIITMTACNSSTQNEAGNMHDRGNLDMPEQHASISNSDNLISIKATYSDVSPEAAQSINEIIDHYLDIKNALTNEDAAAAAKGAKAMAAAMKSLDKSLLTAEQKTEYDKSAETAEGQAEAISANGNNIEQEREAFSTMSESVYAMAKAFGAGRPLYHDHCPMYKDGSMWLSESKEIRNPYYADKMMTCGTAKEIIQ